MSFNVTGSAYTPQKLIPGTVKVPDGQLVVPLEHTHKAASGRITTDLYYAQADRTPTKDGDVVMATLKTPIRREGGRLEVFDGDVFVPTTPMTVLPQTMVMDTQPKSFFARIFDALTGLFGR